MPEQISAPPNATACLILEDGHIYWGRGFGSYGTTTGEVCFNTSMTGYQEILTDPSYTGQIITFTFPHIGNTGTNPEDMESDSIAAQGLILRNDVTSPANWRSNQDLVSWLSENNKTGICGIDTRELTHLIRDKGAQNVLIAYPENGVFNIEDLRAQLAKAPSMKGLDLALTVSCTKPYKWEEPSFSFEEAETPTLSKHVVVIDYGVKQNILRMLVDQGCSLTVVPCQTSAEDILKLNPDGIFLSNGPGDPSATADYAVPVIKTLLDKNIPIFGICLGHQLLAHALGGQTRKLEFGHRGANHPVKT